ncbi:MAG TPA: hypothetical protein PKW14_12270 [Bacteroidota bacterium]|jgi:hypothetical protein|nr:hypothetical protein [Bacteroidota bacterium]
MKRKGGRIDNPLSELISDDVYELLRSHSLLDEKAIRDYQIRKMFKEMRKELSAGDAIDKIRDMYPYLQFDTIRKIVYQISSKGMQN